MDKVRWGSLAAWLGKALVQGAGTQEKVWWTEGTVGPSAQAGRLSYKDSGRPGGGLVSAVLPTKVDSSRPSFEGVARMHPAGRGGCLRWP